MNPLAKFLEMVGWSICTIADIAADLLESSNDDGEYAADEESDLSDD